MSAFAGLRVLDFTGGIGGPMTAMLIGDFGAQIIKMEPPRGDRMAGHAGYLCWNRNKQRLVLDLHQPDGLEQARRLLATADVALFDAAPGELERLGLDATTLHRTNPALVHAWLPPHAVAGRWSQLPPSELLLSAISGIAWMQFSYEPGPVALETPQLSYAQAMASAGAIASALVRRARTGQGESVVVSGLHAVASVQSGSQTKFGDQLQIARPGSRGNTPNYRLYQCADGEWLFLGTLTPPFFLRALEAMDLLDLIAIEGVEGEFANLLRPPMDAVAIEWLDRRFAEKPRDDWLKILSEAGAPRGPVGRREQWFASETIAANQMRLEFDDPRHGRVAIPGVPVKLSATPGAVTSLMTDIKPDAFPEHAALPASEHPLASGTGPLAGIRVLDLGAFIAGTYAPTILASYGADVVKVEALDGDPFRIAGMQFVGHNRGKRGLSIDLKHPDGHAAFLDLVRVSDVVLDNYRNGVRERLGIDYKRLREVNPRIISCSITGYGPEGPLAADPGFDPILQARSGMMAGQGGQGEPVFYQIAVNDSATAMMGAFGIVAALYARERTGEGQEVLTCLANQSVLCQSGEITWYEGRQPNPPGGRDNLGASALSRFYRCSDGWLGLACTRAEHFQQLCIALGHGEWAGRTIAEAALSEPIDGPLAQQIAEALALMPRDEAVDRLLARGVPAAPALTIQERFADPFAAENRCFDTYDHRDFGEVTGPRAYADFALAGGGFTRPAPSLGEHSTEVLRDFGFDDGRIAALLADRVIMQAP